MTNRSDHPLVDSVHDVAAALAQGTPLTGGELDELRDAASHLRRAIEVRSISGAAICLWCAEPYAREASMSAFCSAECREQADRERLSDLGRRTLV